MFSKKIILPGFLIYSWFFDSAMGSCSRVASKTSSCENEGSLLLTTYCRFSASDTSKQALCTSTIQNQNEQCKSYVNGNVEFCFDAIVPILAAMKDQQTVTTFKPSVPNTSCGINDWQNTYDGCSNTRNNLKNQYCNPIDTNSIKLECFKKVDVSADQCVKLVDSGNGLCFTALITDLKSTPVGPAPVSCSTENITKFQSECNQKRSLLKNNYCYIIHESDPIRKNCIDVVDISSDTCISAFDNSQTYCFDYTIAQLKSLKPSNPQTTTTVYNPNGPNTISCATEDWSNTYNRCSNLRSSLKNECNRFDPQDPTKQTCGDIIDQSADTCVLAIDANLQYCFTDIKNKIRALISGMPASSVCKPSNLVTNSEAGCTNFRAMLKSTYCKGLGFKDNLLLNCIYIIDPVADQCLSFMKVNAPYCFDDVIAKLIILNRV